MEGCGDLRGGRVAEVVSERQELRLRPETSRRNGVLLAASVLIAIQLGFRAWASFRGWFYADDFEFLTEAVDQPLTIGYLFTPHDSQLMPGGVLASWIVERSGTWGWGLAAGVLLMFQALASAACLWMLVRLFGVRWAILPLLSIYLFSTLTLTAYLWWAAAINQVPMQAATFAAVGLHVTYLRTGRLRYALAVMAVVLLGLAFYVKTVLVLGPLVLLTLTHFTDWSAGPRAVAQELWRRHRVALGVYAGLAVAYVVLYVATVPSPLGTGGDVDHAGLATAMFGRSLGPALLGGPWRWSNGNPPVAQVATPGWAVTVSWVVLLLGLVAVLRRRPRAWLGLVVVLPYLAVTYLLTAWGRGAVLGSFAGLELRYLADSTPILVLAVGLLALPLAERHTESPPATDNLRSGSHVIAGAVIATTLVGGAVWSNVAYAGFWESFPAETYVKNVTAESEQRPLLVLDEPVPELVMSATSYPSNLPSHLLAPIGDQLAARDAATDPDMLGSDGRPYSPAITGGAASTPGPDGDCGYRVGTRQTRVDMAGEPEDYFWWASVSYLSDGDGKAQLSVGESNWTMPVERGLHRWFVRGRGGIDAVTLEASTGSPAICVDQVDIGTVAPLEPL